MGKNKTKKDQEMNNAAEQEVLQDKEKLQEAETAAKDPEKKKSSRKGSGRKPYAGRKSAHRHDEELQKKYLRLAADFQNFRRRTEKEKNDIYAFANERFALALLEVLDNFERAMKHANESRDPKFVEGMQLILKQMQGVLDKNNVVEIEALGKPFDPNFHNAVMIEEAEDCESGTVTKVLQKGYMLNKKVIRPSMVAVAQ